ncbi:unnamed protein product [Vitrella brassicaformis CCMP3155]|uniref:Uncharacterized protein n=1 Tax=Vitrella brassicaformis (strain CCMP3155) TaxID=1169540 RepID=A0A0G4FMS9_VITBC|nr:unnamed protein product [Vitrella brassicaformis CCMP3155]|eukprot:CEM15077.1 unnamed protein product [Vitrella brassicaformis CCMP3155]
MFCYSSTRSDEQDRRLHLISEDPFLPSNVHRWPPAGQLPVRCQHPPAAVKGGPAFEDNDERGGRSLRVTASLNSLRVVQLEVR